MCKSYLETVVDDFFKMAAETGITMKELSKETAISMKRLKEFQDKKYFPYIWEFEGLEHQLRKMRERKRREKEEELLKKKFGKDQ
jgi:hypothetical protein